MTHPIGTKVRDKLSDTVFTIEMISTLDGRNTYLLVSADGAICTRAEEDIAQVPDLRLQMALSQNSPSR